MARSKTKIKPHLKSSVLNDAKNEITKKNAVSKNKVAPKKKKK